jgi:ribose 5-phosphate isomerase B
MPRTRVVTERDVRRAAKSGNREIDVAGAVVTPSARDAAAKVGVTLKGRAESAWRGAGGGGMATPPVGTSPSTEASSPPPSDSPRPAARQVALGADHGGVALKDAIAAHLRDLGHTVTDHGTTGSAPVDYPDYAIAVARSVAAGHAQVGIMVDGAGIGSCMAANKVAGVRAAMCYDVTTAVNAREHNNANVLTLGGGLIGPRLAVAIVDAFLSADFGGGRHAARVAKIDALDGERLPR